MQNQSVQPQRRPLKIILIILLIALAVAATSLWLGWMKVQSMLEPVSTSHSDILVTIPSGASSATIGELLEDSGVIHNATLFRLWLRYNEVDGKIQAGDYVLSPSHSLEEVVDRLVRGDVHRETLRFTVPEGLFITDIARVLADQQIVDEDKFLELATDVDQWQHYWFVQEIPGDVDQPLDGYLFPETYEIDAKVEDRERLVISTMLNQFDRVFDEERRQRIEERDLTAHQVLTLASIVEKEAVVADERALIAGVFLNRLDENMPLQSCATVNYVLEDFTIRYLSDEQLQTPSPYNTYQNTGLPPGPIAGAGRQAIEAVLWPEETDYRFFVAKDDGSNEHYFAKTYAEHQINVGKARDNRS